MIEVQLTIVNQTWHELSSLPMNQLMVGGNGDPVNYSQLVQQRRQNAEKSMDSIDLLFCWWGIVAINSCGISKLKNVERPIFLTIARGERRILGSSFWVSPDLLPDGAEKRM